jgi:hypothetical protein
MSALPCSIYRAPGSIRRARYSYDTMLATTQQQLDARIASGWHLTLEQALDAAGESASLHLANRKVRTRKVRLAAPPAERRASFKRAAFDAKIEQDVSETTPVEIPTAIPDDNAAPTRIELVAKATELGLKFSKRTSDERLLAMITEALKEA